MQINIGHIFYKPFPLSLQSSDEFMSHFLDAAKKRK